MAGALLAAVGFWLLGLAWHGRRRSRFRDLHIDGRRVNDEDRRLRRFEISGDVRYRARVMRRMTAGVSGKPETWLTADRMRPLYNRQAFLAVSRSRKARDLAKNVLPMPKKESR